jgi:hypothetical protein
MSTNDQHCHFNNTYIVTDFNWNYTIFLRGGGSNSRAFKSVTIHTYCMLHYHILVSSKGCVCSDYIKTNLLLFSSFKELNSRCEFTGCDQSK